MHNILQERTDCVLGIDTSNYKTSAAIIDADGNIVCDHRQLLKVKQGERGLRQSDALFQHVKNLPELIKKCFTNMDPSRIRAVAYSDKPRPVEGSYMPVFNAGTGMAESIAAALGVPCFGFSHQEGHIEAIRYRTSLADERELLCYHLSGGTCELLKVNGDDIEIIGGSKDISFGQVIDRVGVKLGMQFPAGEYMDAAALDAAAASKYLKKISTDGLFFNLSGIETQAGRKADELIVAGEDFSPLIREVMDKLARLLIEVTENAAESTSMKNIIFTGGVASSKYISNILKNHFTGSGITIEFGDQNLSQDNAVGIALLGGRKIWR